MREFTKRMQTISLEQLNQYQASAKKRRAQRQQRHLERQQQDWQGAQVLNQEFGATQVKLLGSMLVLHHTASDVDLALERVKL
jgi:predicted nucleotidyltransferase